MVTNPNIIGILLLMLGDMFNYDETKDEICSLNHFNTYYQKVKDSLKSEYVTKAIEKIVISVKNKLKYVAQYNLMRVSIFCFSEIV